MKTIVISAVNLVEAGTLEILRACLGYLSSVAATKQYRVVALVYDRNLINLPNIEYIETKWPKKRWTNRLWYEYVEMNKISKTLAPVDLWFSLHDTTPTVEAKIRAVYCHNSFSFYKWKVHDLLFAPKIAMFAIFTKSIYRTNIQANNYLVVQQNWFREAMAKMFDFPKSKIIVAPPKHDKIEMTHLSHERKDENLSFVFAGSPNSHKNFEVIAKACAILEEEQGISNFKASITVKGTENKYAAWLYKNWGHLKTLQFAGFQPKKDMDKFYAEADCLIFPSKVESWGLPISEFSNYGKPMILSDLPYAHETASGSAQVAYFNPDNSRELASLMHELIQGNVQSFQREPDLKIAEPLAHSWADVFTELLKSSA